MPENWAEVDDFFAERLLPPDRVLEAVLAANAEAGLPAIDVSPQQGAFLNLLVQISGARAVLEIGTLGGFSTICMARALPPGGRLTTLELDPHHAAIAAANLARAGMTDRVDLRIGAGLDILPALAGPFDLVFIDADKPNSPHYLRHALRLSWPGTVIVLDNVVRGGAVTNPNGDANAQGVRAALDLIAAEPALQAMAMQTVGIKGWDGFVLARVST